MCGAEVPGLAERLSGGDRRSTGAADQIAREAHADPAVVADLVALMRHPDPVVAMRAADVAEKATRADSDVIAAQREPLLRLAGEATQQEVRWHVAQLLPRLPLGEGQAQQVCELLERYLDDQSQIVRANALEAITDLAVTHPALGKRARTVLDHHAAHGGKAVRARCRRLRARLDGAGG